LQTFSATYRDIAFRGDLSRAENRPDLGFDPTSQTRLQVDSVAARGILRSFPHGFRGTSAS